MVAARCSPPPAASSRCSKRTSTIRHTAVEGVRLAIEVADAQTIHDRVASRGIAITEAIDDRPWKHRSFTIDDPNGLALTFFNVID